MALLAESVLAKAGVYWVLISAAHAAVRWSKLQAQLAS